MDRIVTYSTHPSVDRVAVMGVCFVFDELERWIVNPAVNLLACQQRQASVSRPLVGRAPDLQRRCSRAQLGPGARGACGLR